MRKIATIAGMSLAVLTTLIIATEARPTARKPGQGAADRVTVKFSNFKFEPKEVTITVGTTVEWIDEEGRHTIEADNGAFKSPTLTKGGRFEFKFTKPGTYPYHCGFHGDQGGKDMAGVIKVTPRGK